MSMGLGVRCIRLFFAGLYVEFSGRDLGLNQLGDWAKRGMWSPVVVFGAEGCGKSAPLKQAVEVLREKGYSVALVSPSADKEGDRLMLTEKLREIGRHRWADLFSMWNMPRDGFKALYSQLPGEMPSFEEVWRLEQREFLAVGAFV